MASQAFPGKNALIRLLVSLKTAGRVPTDRFLKKYNPVTFHQKTFYRRLKSQRKHWDNWSWPGVASAEVLLKHTRPSGLSFSGLRRDRDGVWLLQLSHLIVLHFCSNIKSVSRVDLMKVSDLYRTVSMQFFRLTGSHRPPWKVGSFAFKENMFSAEKWPSPNRF